MTATDPPANPSLRIEPLPATLIELIPVALLHLGQGRKFARQPFDPVAGRKLTVRHIRS